MTSREAFQGIRKIEACYGEKFLPVDVAPIWNDLLQQPAAAMAHTVGEMSMIWRRMPTADQLLAKVKAWTARLELTAVEKGMTEGQALFSLMNGFLSGKIPETEYIQGLYVMAETFGKPEYAHDAARREEQMKARAP
ncbi:hypothetical protein F6V25_07890 [Oryzomonas japonica]|uniref:Uncharacterized protein n=1 Tax=Oryzomonas japonica TaxID=2603858 RepID=A0A7J4ZR21_9BACT|nr:hypothetical protein [Oryzomonas japonica]KAB0665634.1 hypothetical protein F6V25_07890 [Oryzomonas japonica]